MRTVSLAEARSRLEEIIDADEPVTIIRDGRPIATIEPRRQRVQAVVNRIRAMAATSGFTLSNEEIVALVKSGRR